MGITGLGSALAAATDLVLPQTCAGCDQPGAVICPSCRREIAELAMTRGLVSPHPVPEGWPGCTGTVYYSGLSARLARTFKDGHRRDLAQPLGRLLADAVGRAVSYGLAGDGAPFAVVPVPSSPAAIRRRGDQPTLLLAREVARSLGPRAVVMPVLRMARGTADQAGLGRGGRLANLDRAMAVVWPEAMRGQRCVLVDDVLTSGATLMEGRRALLAGGASQVALAVAMVTARRTGPGLPFLSGED